MRVQWDPERDLWHRPLGHRSIQIGLSGEAVDRYVDEWIVSIRDVTGSMREVKKYLDRGDVEEAARLLPVDVCLSSVGGASERTACNVMLAYCLLAKKENACYFRQTNTGLPVLPEAAQDRPSQSPRRAVSVPSSSPRSVANFSWILVLFFSMHEH